MISKISQVKLSKILPSSRFYLPLSYSSGSAAVNTAGNSAGKKMKYSLRLTAFAAGFHLFLTNT
jgi:hypothetical protein